MIPPTISLNDNLADAAQTRNSPPAPSEARGEAFFPAKDLDLSEILNAESVQPLMEDFNRLTRIPMAIIDLKGKVLAGAGWQDICIKFHRIHPDTCRNCLESDVELTTGVPPGEFRVYRCKNHMWDVATPLTIGGQHVANVFSGQFFFDDEPLDYDLFREQARRYGFDEESYIAALERAPRLSRAVVKTGMSYLTRLAHLLSVLSYRNVELAKAIAERDLFMQSLKESEERLNRAQAIAHVGSWQLDLVKQSLSWSDEVYRIFGLQPQEFGATYEAFLAFVHPDDREAVNAAYSNSLRDGKSSYETAHRIVRRQTGEVRWVREKCENVFDGSGRAICSIGMVQDITETRRADERIRHKEKLESVGLLAAGIAHDFNNLLVGVLGNASIAKEMIDSSHPVNNLLDDVVRAGQSAADLTRQMLAYAGKGQFVVESIDLPKLAEETCALLEHSISKRISLWLDLNGCLPAIEGDPGQIQQVFMNLLINAAEAIGDQPGSISVAASLLNADAHYLSSRGFDLPPGSYVRFEVSDTGCGMDAETQARIFEPFFTTKFMGRGLGLAGAAGIVRSHRGAIHVITAPGQGSRFTVLFPAAGPVARGGERQAAPARLRGTESVLVVDDEEPVRTLAGKVLGFYGYRVLTASNGAEAIEVCRRDRRIDAVVLDSSMPVLGGVETIPHLRAIDPQLKILLSSGYDEAETMRRAAGHRISGFVQKPYLPKTLVAKLRLAFDE